MNIYKLLKYIGATLMMGCTVALIFTIIFIAVIHIQIAEAFLAITFFATTAALGIFITKTNLKQTTQQNQEATTE